MNPFLNYKPKHYNNRKKAVAVKLALARRSAKADTPTPQANKKADILFLLSALIHCTTPTKTVQEARAHRRSTIFASFSVCAIRPLFIQL
jgi:hypothetical protein